MSSQYKPSVDEVHSDVKVVERSTRVRPYEVLLRFLGLSLTLVATIIVGIDKETKRISYAEMHFEVTAKWEYMSAIVFFLVSNAIACSYAAASLVITVMPKSNINNNVTLLVITLVDLVIMALLFSANGAASAVGEIGQHGNSHVQWFKVCNVFDAYCRHMTVALVLSIIGSTIFLLLVALSILKLHYNK
ncbi:hypothetical protein TanjilG_06261 [Lupinus angustifolius]|uniref:CASP-like protein n=1 Tax=Lupinus angustifolius TaxID=3871 RepID=A0A1J7GZ69_LUPAN|nr:PREDICTED: CASP-like protein 1E1 [Lupinus angustifolius]OIV95392.1 hypothetical protein TanjilG_06261 [Lupinus angustifolius]